MSDRDEQAVRRAAQLRVNLKRRKAQARGLAPGIPARAEGFDRSGRDDDEEGEGEEGEGEEGEGEEGRQP